MHNYAFAVWNVRKNKRKVLMLLTKQGNHDELKQGVPEKVSTRIMVCVKLNVFQEHSRDSHYYSHILYKVIATNPRSIDLHLLKIKLKT